MSKDFIPSRTKLYLLSAVALSFALSGCSSDFGPFSMPSGYAHHNKEYKAPPGAELLAIPEEKAGEGDMAAMPAEEVEEDPLATMDFTTEPEDYVHEAPISHPDESEHKPQNLLKEEITSPSADKTADLEPAVTPLMAEAEPANPEEPVAVMKKTQSGVVVGAAEDYEINAYESYVQKTYVYDKSYEERRLKEAAARAEQADASMERRTVEKELSDISDMPPADAAIKDTEASKAAKELIGQITKEFGQPVEPVYLAPLKADHQALHEALWAAMEEEGFTVTDKEGRGPFVLKYAIMSAPEGQQDMARVTLTMMSGKMLVAQVSDNYALAVPETGDDMAPIGAAAMAAEPEQDIPSYDRDPGVSYPPEEAASEPVSLFEP